jgi:hypothetical protein
MLPWGSSYASGIGKVEAASRQLRFAFTPCKLQVPVLMAPSSFQIRLKG